MNQVSAATPMHAHADAPRWPVRYLLFIGGMGGLLYGIDIGIIAGALPYLEAMATASWHLASQQLGFVVAAVLVALDQAATIGRSHGLYGFVSTLEQRLATDDEEEHRR